MNFDHFHHSTYADFVPCATPHREPDFISLSRSAYWDEGDFVVRCSDHWGRVRSCWWLYDGCRRHGPTQTGVCRYLDFWPIVRVTHDGRVVAHPSQVFIRRPRHRVHSVLGHRWHRRERRGRRRRRE